ncbi:MAG: PAS domain S-box protein, partial [Dissulfurispiraceae bacterium]
MNRKSFDKDFFSQPTDVLNTVLDNITHGIVVVGSDYRILSFNRYFEDLFQLPLGTVEVGVDFREVLKRWAEVTGQDRQMLTRAIIQLDEPTTFEFEFPQLINGERRWCLLIHNPLPGKGFVRTFTDITERKLAEERLRKNEEKLEAYLHNISDTLWLIDSDLNMAYVSPSVTRLMGLLPEDIIGKPSALVIHPDDMGVIADAQRYVIEHPGEPHTIQYRVKHKDGRWIHVESTGINLFDNPAINGILVTMRDINERKQAEEALRESERLLRESQIIAGLGNYILDVPTGLWTSSDLLDKLFGIDKAYERSVEGWVALIHPDDRAMMVDYFKNEILGKAKAFDKEYRIVRYEDKVERWVHGSGKLELDVHGRPLKMHGTIQDITDRKKMEEQLRQAQKLEAIGTLAGGIAHDFNNLLQGIFGYISMAKLNAADKDKSVAALEQAEKALHMSVKLTTQLLTFSKGGKPVKNNISLQSVIENSVRFALSGSSADYRIKLDADFWNVEADEGQIGQVIQNIVLNADQSMPLGGTIVITAKNVQGSRKAMPQLPEGRHVEISIQDKGVGISEEYLSKIFDPYFTTKAKGSGLGLATCYSIIKNHGGVI